MNIPVKSEYTLAGGSLDLSLQPPGEPVKIADIARRPKIPRKFLELILASLARAAASSNLPRAEGGYRLAVTPPTKRPPWARCCVSSKTVDQTKRAASNPFHQIWKQVDAAVAGILDHTTFAELARNWQKSQTRYVANWDI